ncbi:MAG: hypothetical protein MI749_18955 [Desulfovibrionales bacterium]|nr:hypothetical protein [Desulfovibrionales bacterium]
MDFSDFTTWPVSPSMKHRPATFDPEAEAFLGHFSTFSAEMSNLLVELETFQQEINTSEQNTARAVLDARTELDNCRVEVNHCKDEVALARSHADTAYQWAETSRNIEVAPGEYSSRHYMLTTKEYVENLLQDPAFSSSTTPLTIGIGIQALVTAAALSYRPGMWLVIINKHQPRTWMKGYVDFYDSVTGDLSVNITGTSGTGTHSDWLVTQTNPEININFEITALELFKVQSFS